MNYINTNRESLLAHGVPKRTSKVYGQNATKKENKKT